MRCRSCLLVLLVCGSWPSATAQDMTLLELGGGVTLGSTYTGWSGRPSRVVTPELGWGFHADALRALGADSRIGFNIGLRLRQRIHRQSYQDVSGYSYHQNGGMSYSVIHYDGTFRSKEWRVSVPMQFMFRLGSRSRLIAGIETGVVFYGTGIDEGTRTTNTSTYPPGSGGDPIETSDQSGYYYTARSSDTDPTLSLELDLGYRRSIGNRLLVGLDVSFIHLMFRSGPGVTELALWCGWRLQREGASEGPKE